MTPEQLLQTASLLREHCPPPSPSQPPGAYVISEAVYRLASAVGQIAREISVEEPSIEVRKEQPCLPQPPVDDARLREVALDFSLRAQRGTEEGAVIVARAEILLAFLRGDPPSRASQEDAAWKAGER